MSSTNAMNHYIDNFGLFSKWNSLQKNKTLSPCTPQKKITLEEVSIETTKVEKGEANSNLIFLGTFLFSGLYNDHGITDDSQ